MHGQPIEDVRSLELIASGDRRAFREIYDRYFKKIYLYAYRHLGEPEGSKEIANEVMLEIWRCAKRFRGESKPSTWIFGIAVNKIRKEFKRRSPFYASLESVKKQADDRVPQDDATYKSQVREKMQIAIKMLTPEHREVIDLCYYQEFSVKEMSKILGCPPNTVKTRMFYARKKLGTILDEMGIGGIP